MNVIVRWGRELWDFVVGDDWRMAVSAVAGIAAVAVLAAVHVTAWWVLPVVIPLVLLLGTRRA